LTLPIGSHGEEITTRRLQIVSNRRNQYSGRAEYQLKDDARNRIDYTQWFEEGALSRHDISIPDPICKRATKAGKPCPAAPTYPSGLCIKHKAKLDWDRQRQRRKLEAELEKRRKEKSISTREELALEADTKASNPGDISDLLESGTDDASPQVSMRMWGEADLFARATAPPFYFQDHHLGNPPTYHSSIPLPTPGLQLQVANLRLFRTCLIMAYLAAITISSSIAIAMWWTIAHKDPSGGFTMAGYIVAVGGIVMFPIQSHHTKSCKCWKRTSRAARTPAT
jgi:hypothetical protein